MKYFQISLCTNKDFISIFELLKQLWPTLQLNYETLQVVYENSLKSDKQKLVVGLMDNKIVVFCSLTVKNNLWQAENLGHIDELVKGNSFRRQGIRRKIMDEITKIAKDNHCKRIELDSAFHRKGAHLFYKQSGYENRAYLFSKEI